MTHDFANKHWIREITWEQRDRELVQEFIAIVKLAWRNLVGEYEQE